MNGDAEITELERETRSSITLKRSAKLEPYWDVKVYFESGNEDAAEDALARVARIDEALRATFLPKPREPITGQGIGIDRLPY